MSTIDKNSENGYYPVKWTSDFYTLKSYHNIGRYFIKAGELVFDELYLNPFSNFKKCYISCEKNEGNTIFRLNIVILTMVKVQS